MGGRDNTTLDIQGLLTEGGHLSRELSEENKPDTGSSRRKTEQAAAKHSKVLEVEMEGFQGKRLKWLSADLLEKYSWFFQ